MYMSCAAQKDGATQLDPQHYKYFPSPVPRAGYALATLQRPDRHPTQVLHTMSVVV
jgi:hypothetical protein